MTKDELSALFLRYGPMVYRRARVLLGDHAEAEEAAQEVFVRAVMNHATFEARSKVSTWLYQITTNHCLNLIRDRKRRREILEAHAAEQGASPISGAPSSEQMVLLRQLLAEADETSARAAVYVHVDGMSHQEAAELLGVSRRTVGNLLERFGAWARARADEPVPVSQDGVSHEGGGRVE
jgi:RNA polymerase sigma-70 factor (ECF subfamily)